MSNKSTKARPSRPEPVEVDIERVQEIYHELGIDKPTAVTFMPKFREDVFVIGVDGQPVQVNPNYCSTVASAMGLMLILADLNPVGYLDDPQQFSTGSTFVFTSQVPWLRFDNGAVRNAAQLTQFWKANSGDPGGKNAENNARMDIAWG